VTDAEVELTAAADVLTVGVVDDVTLTTDCPVCNIEYTLDII